AVGVSEGNEVQSRSLEARSQGRPVAQVVGMLQEPNVRVGYRLRPDNLRGSVRAAVIDHDNLVLGYRGSEGGLRLPNGLPDSFPLMPSGDDEGKPKAASFVSLTLVI